MRVYACGCARARACVWVCVYVEERNMYIGTIHQLSTCNQRFRGLMTVRFKDHRPHCITDGTLSYQKRGRRDIDEDNGDVVECMASRLSQTIVKIIVVL